MTITSNINLYNSVFNGETCTSNGYVISSDGIDWIVDGIHIDTLENKRKYLETLLKKVEFVKPLLAEAGEDTSQINDEFCATFSYDSSTSSLLLVRLSQESLVFVDFSDTLPETNAMIEQIDIKKGIMRCHYFRQAFNEAKPKRFLLEGTLSAKSKEMIDLELKGHYIPMTYNFYYDMLFEGMTSFRDLVQALLSEPELETDIHLRRRLDT